jgi:hypothetical protein
MESCWDQFPLLEILLEISVSKFKSSPLPTLHLLCSTTKPLFLQALIPTHFQPSKFVEFLALVAMESSMSELENNVIWVLKMVPPELAAVIPVPSCKELSVLPTLPMSALVSLLALEQALFAHQFLLLLFAIVLLPTLVQIAFLLTVDKPLLVDNVKPFHPNVDGAAILKTLTKELAFKKI